MRPIYIKNILTKIVNLLTSTESDAALSAKQGKILNEKIATIPNNPATPPPINVSDIIVDTSLVSNDTNKAPSIRLTNASLSTKVSLDPITNTIPDDTIPDEAIETIDHLRLIGGTNIKVSDIDNNNTYMISKADTKEDVVNYINELKISSATSNQKWIDICYCKYMNNGTYFAIAEDTNRAMKSSNGKDWEEVTLPDTMKYSSVGYNSKSNTLCIVSRDSKELQHYLISYYTSLKIRNKNLN